MNQQQLEQKAKEAYPTSTDPKNWPYNVRQADKQEAFIAGASWMQGEGERLRETDRLKRQELKLALHMLLKVFKTATKTPGQQKYYDAAEKVLTKNFEITDILRSEPPKPQTEHE